MYEINSNAPSTVSFQASQNIYIFFPQMLGIYFELFSGPEAIQSTSCTYPSEIRIKKVINILLKTSNRFLNF